MLCSVPLNVIINIVTVLRHPNSLFASIADELLKLACDALPEANDAEADDTDADTMPVATFSAPRAELTLIYLFLIKAKWSSSLDNNSNNASFWQPYLDALPVKGVFIFCVYFQYINAVVVVLVGTPLTWNENENLLLTGTNARAATRSLLITLWRCYDTLVPGF